MIYMHMHMWLVLKICVHACTGLYLDVYIWESSSCQLYIVKGAASLAFDGWSGGKYLF